MRLVRPVDRPYYPRDAETLLDEALYTMQPEERGRLMAEHPGAYRRYINAKGFGMGSDLDVYLNDGERQDLVDRAEAVHRNVSASLGLAD
jgi:hypothetical protein